MKHIAFLSFGKDSIAQLIKIKELGLPLDEVVYVDIRYTPEISGEHPIMAAWIPTAEKIIKEKLGYTVKHLSAQYSFREYFYRKKQKGAHVGEIYGFPFQVGAWCNSRLKLDVIKQYENSLHDEITEYIGIAADEVERMFTLRARATDKIHKRSVLYENNITERMAFDICKPYDLVSPIYNITARGGCWFCPKQRIYSVYCLWRDYPEYFNDLKTIEKDSRCLMLKTQSLEDLENRFINGYIPKQRQHTTGNFTPRRSANTKEVCIPACFEHEGYKTVKVKLYWFCPVCGKRRGKIKTVKSYDGSLCLFCDGWENPCDPDCKHTSDITHAKNFTPADINGKYPVKAGGAEIFIERIDEIPLLPENETITTIGVDPDFSTDKFVATIEKTITDARAANRQNDCPFQIQDGDEWFCGKITDARVVCPDMADFKACGGYPYKKLKEFCEELNRKATKIIEQYRGEK